jgi:hypothetical protein
VLAPRRLCASGHCVQLFAPLPLLIKRTHSPPPLNYVTRKDYCLCFVPPSKASHKNLFSSRRRHNYPFEKLIRCDGVRRSLGVKIDLGHEACNFIEIIVTIKRDERVCVRRKTMVHNLCGRARRRSVELSCHFHTYLYRRHQHRSTFRTTRVVENM